MPALHSVGCFAVHCGSAQPAAPSDMESKRRMGLVQPHTQTTDAGGIAKDQRRLSLQRKLPLVQRKAYFDSAEYFMAKEQGTTVMPIMGLPRAEPSLRTANRQPSRLRFSSH